MVSFPLLTVPHTDKQAVALADCTGVTRCLLYSRVIYSFEGKNQQTSRVHPALCLGGNGRAPQLLPPPQCHPALSPRGRAREEKKLFPVAHTGMCTAKGGERSWGQEGVEGGERKRDPSKEARESDSNSFQSVNKAIFKVSFPSLFPLLSFQTELEMHSPHPVFLLGSSR